MKSKAEDIYARSVHQWRLLHDNGYFDNHRHCVGFPVSQHLSDEMIGRLLTFKEDDVVLEIGCGYGRIVSAVADHVKEIVGIDVHDNPINRGRKLLRDKPNAALYVTDGMTIPFPERTFTVVYSCSVMQHLPRPLVERYISEACRVLTVGGVMCIQFQNAFFFPAERHKAIRIDRAKEQTRTWFDFEIAQLVIGLPLRHSIARRGKSDLYLIAEKTNA
jgi:ubiquinone/menaquinone biosynthesis C-methylase UbiE